MLFARKRTAYCHLYNAAENYALQILASDREWKDLSISTDYRCPDST